jgi:hypothetical protein
MDSQWAFRRLSGRKLHHVAIRQLLWRGGSPGWELGPAAGPLFCLETERWLRRFRLLDADALQFKHAGLRF